MRVRTANFRKRRGILALVLIALVVAVGIYASVGSGRDDPQGRQALASRAQRHTSARAAAQVAAVKAPPPPLLKVSAPEGVGGGWSTTALVHGRPAAWLARRAGVTLMRFDQRLVHLDLHAGYDEGGESGLIYGDRIGPREIHTVVAGFNGGFKFSYGGVGFLSGGHVADPLSRGLGSVVTYTDGTSDVGAWDAGVPSSRRSVFSVLQNQHLLVDRGAAAANVESCILDCWGATVGGQTVVARSALGVTQSGELVWGAGEQLTPGELAHALIGAGVVRAVELDINFDWVAGYLYVHHSGGPSAVPVVPGQHGIAGELLAPNSRDFFAVVAN